jgi:hydrogenase maturation protein HypF
LILAWFALFIDAMKHGLRIRINGMVQGVGFRPNVWRLAQNYKISGDVRNDGKGVLIHAFGTEQAIDDFVSALKTDIPPLARIDLFETSEIDPSVNISEDFQIIASRQGDVQTHIVPDAATCPECLKEVRDPLNRRYRYPFTNCTHCGPRLSIVKALPYDRQNTTMAAFKMCPVCQSEYDDPMDRRFHAQPNACPACGPQVWLEYQNGTQWQHDNSDSLSECARLIKKGAIVAIKGIGGFHLACDALNEQAVASLRERKKRPSKPFALMARDLDMITHYADYDEEEAAALSDCAAPVVLLSAKSSQIATNVAPNYQSLGFMLPYTPLHHILMAEMDGPIVLTSANRSHEPQVIDNDEAREKLSDIADYFLMHDRDIENRLDDSVMRKSAGKMRFLRRARGFAPAPLMVPEGFDPSVSILSMGAELKNTFGIVHQGKAVVSQHMGDQENLLAHLDFRKNIDLYSQLHVFSPDLIVHDHHPDFLPTKWAQELAAHLNVQALAVQHHHAHICAIMAEHGLSADHDPVLGVVLDGLGLSDGGDLWGGEFLLADYRQFERVAHIPAVALIGGEKAMKEPWRNLFAHFDASMGWDAVLDEYSELSVIKNLKSKPLLLCQQMLEKQLNCPTASSAGRLFDAVAALLDICFEQISYEGEAAILLEQLAENSCDETIYSKMSLSSWDGLFYGLLRDLSQGVSKEDIAKRFHNSIIDLLFRRVLELQGQHKFKIVVLGGGVFQNKILLEGILKKLQSKKITALCAQRLPNNDGAISFGQLFIAKGEISKPNI